MQLDIVAGFFVLGVLAVWCRCGLVFPRSLYQATIIFLLLAIGLKGGAALHAHASIALIAQAVAIVAFGIILPLLAFPILRYIGDLSRENAASVAAHYGSVSIATYAVAVAFLQSRNIAYEEHFPLFVALLEVPAIAVGIWLARPRDQVLRSAGLLHEVFFNQGVFLLGGGLVIGWWAGARVESVLPFFDGLFHGVLALFLLEMGRTAATQSVSLRQYGSFISSFAVLMPLTGAFLGGLLASALGFSVGGMILLATLGASASYIAVPAAMSVAVPTADSGLPISASLAVTFPFNILVGIPLYTAIIQNLAS